MSRLYLVSGFFIGSEYATQPMAGTALLEDDEVMDHETLRKVQRLLLDEMNSMVPPELAYRAMSITHFQPFETRQAQLNSPETLPPVGCPLLIEVEGKLLPAERAGHISQRGQDMTYQLADGRLITGQYFWTYP